MWGPVKGMGHGSRSSSRPPRGEKVQASKISEVIFGLHDDLMVDFVWDEFGLEAEVCRVRTE
jgi:hypothetical protein